MYRCMEISRRGSILDMLNSNRVVTSTLHSQRAVYLVKDKIRGGPSMGIPRTFRLSYQFSFFPSFFLPFFSLPNFAIFSHFPRFSPLDPRQNPSVPPIPSSSPLSPLERISFHLSGLPLPPSIPLFSILLPLVYTFSSGLLGFGLSAEPYLSIPYTPYAKPAPSPGELRVEFFILV